MGDEGGSFRKQEKKVLRNKFLGNRKEYHETAIIYPDFSLVGAAPGPYSGRLAGWIGAEGTESSSENIGIIDWTG